MPTPRTRKPAGTVTKTSTVDNGDLSAILGTVQPSATGVKRAAPKDVKPILTLDHVRQSLETGTALAYTVQTRDQAEALKSDLQRAAAELKCGLSKSITERDGNFVVDFEATATRRKRNYTSADIRQWARDEKGWDLSGTAAIPEEVRTAYRIAKGHAKAPKPETVLPATDN